MSDKHFVSVGKGYSLPTSVIADIPRGFFFFLIKQLKTKCEGIF